MTEYIVNKGVGESYVELYRSWDKDDALAYMVSKAEKYGQCDRYSETLVSKVMVWEREGQKPMWFEFVQESNDA